MATITHAPVEQRPAMPLTELPTEVLELIFEYVAEPGTGNHPFHIPTLSHTFGQTPWNHKNAYDLLNVAQTCRLTRQILLPILWRECHLITVAQVEFYDAFLSRSKYGAEVYGKLIRSAYFQLTFSHFVRIYVWEEKTNVMPIRTCDDMTDALIRIFSLASNMSHLTFDAKKMPITRRLANALEVHCPQMHAVKIEAEELTGAGHKMQHSAIPFLDTHLQHVDLGNSCDHLRDLGLGNLSLSDFFHPHEDGPFGFAILPPDSAFIFRTRMVAWWLSIALVGAQNTLQAITLPAIVELYSEPLLFRLWLVLDVRTTAERPEGPPWDIQSQGWVQALRLVRSAFATTGMLKRNTSTWTDAVRTHVRHEFKLDKWLEGGRPEREEWDARKFLIQNPNSETKAELSELNADLLNRSIAASITDILSSVETDTQLQTIIARRFQDA